MLHRGSQNYTRFSYSCTVLQYHSAAAQAGKETPSFSHVLVAYLRGKEHLAVLQRTLARFLSSHLSIRGWVQAELSLGVFCSQSLGTACALGLVPSQPPASFPDEPLPSGMTCQQAPLERQGWVNTKFIFRRSVAGKKCHMLASCLSRYRLVAGAIKNTDFLTFSFSWFLI